MNRFRGRVGPGVVLGFVVAVVAGCAVQPASAPVASKQTALLIDGLTLPQLLGSDELARVNADIPVEYRGDVISAEALGKVVYAHHHLATTAADLLASQGRNALGYPPAGWLVERDSKGLRVEFIVKTAGGIGIGAEMAQVPAGKQPVLDKLATPRGLNAGEQAMWDARQLAYRARITPCTRRYDPVVIPMHAADRDFFYVYLLPVAGDPGVMFLGGYYRITVSADGRQISDTHAFTRSCVSLHRRAKAAGAGVSELISPTPTPPQVYANLLYGMQLYVATATNSIVWDVKDGRIYYVRTMSPQAGSAAGAAQPPEAAGAG